MARNPNRNEHHAQKIVADGHARAYSAAELQVRSAVTAEYVERLKAASLLERVRLRREMAREIRRRLEEQAPPWALY